VNVMMGESRVGQEALFYEFSLERHVPADHLLRSIDRFVDLSGVRAHLRPFYSEIGRPSIDPELMIRMLLIGYCFGIRSERRLCEEVHLNLAYRWFCRLGLEGEVPDHSTFSKNRHGRFRDCDLLRELFETKCGAAWLKGLSVATASPPTPAAVGPGCATFRYGDDTITEGMAGFGLLPRRHACLKLRALFGREKESPNHQKDDRADDGSDQPCPFASFIPADGLAEIGGGKCPDDAENGRQDKPLRFVGTRMDELGDDPGNETNDDGPENMPHGAVRVLLCRF